MTLYRILIEAHGTLGWDRFDLIVLAAGETEARRIALREMRGYGDRRRVVRDSLVPVTIEPRVVMQHAVTW